ncbi:MAG TPA: sugar phosphate isomerase/epimerase family protein [Methanothrix sp.]|nr:sugar phosphate isomerase/epimerase family protein [Methanothrix sp.]HOK58250.1 sugar phosphate isomerase/epimerase family protein [Methanothrix sp.]HOL43574.1 sugar phosphate isomerase/epimerase family protein [Methanothrix sp.]HPO89137.1 sugar phosphate isomerase/epimerase family protein [Methanothrix sp.]
MRIYISTSCLKNCRYLPEVLETYTNAGIRDVEIGSSHSYIEDVDELLKRYSHAKFVIHNYFPPPKDPFMMNLAAQDENIRQRSLDVCRRAIELCSRIGAEFYSFHPGFRVAGTLDMNFSLSGRIIPYEDAFRNFTRSLEKIVSYSREHGIKVAVENLEHKNDAYMMTGPDEFTRVLEMFPEVFVLLDLGHLKIASRMLCFTVEEFISRVRGSVIGIHVHDNDGRSDLHIDPSKSELLEYISKISCSNIILESRNMSMAEILRCLKVLRSRCTSPS